MAIKYPMPPVEALLLLFMFMFFVVSFCCPCAHLYFLFHCCFVIVICEACIGDTVDSEGQNDQRAEIRSIDGNPGNTEERRPIIERIAVIDRRGEISKNGKKCFFIQYFIH